MLAEKMKQFNTNAWIVNTGWTGGAYGAGKRMSLKHTRTIIDAIHSGELNNAEYTECPTFGFAMPKSIEGVPSEILNPRDAWADKAAYDTQMAKLAGMFTASFEKYKDRASPEVIAAGPKH